jgi:hypothetical protein
VPKAKGSVTSDGGRSTFPRPSNRVVRDDETRKTAFRIFEYWAALPADKAELCEFRVYRMWPVIDNKLIGKSTKDEETIRGPIPFKWEEWRDEFFHRYGSGDYHVYLTEAGVPGSVMESYFALKDWEHYPPKIDFRTLIHGHKDNADYVAWLRRHNQKVPWDDPQAEEGELENEEMSVAQEAIKAVSDMAGRVSDVREQLAEAKLDARMKQPSVEASVAQDMGDIYKGAARGAVEVMKESAGHQYNVVEVIGALKEVMAPVPNNNLEMFKMVLDTQKAADERFIGLQNTIIETLRRPEAAPVAVAEKNGIDGALDTLEKFKRVGEVIGWGPPSNSRREIVAAPPVETKPGFWEAAFTTLSSNPQLAQTFITGGVNLINGVIGMFKRGPETSPSYNGGMNGGPSANGYPATQPPEQRPWENLFLENIAPAFLAHFSDPQCSGYSLAETVIGNYLGAGPTQFGRAEYQKAKELVGPTVVNGQPFCRMHQMIMGGLDGYKIWEHVKPMAQKYQGFMEEFFGYDEWLAEQSKPEPAEPVVMKPQVVV